MSLPEGVVALIPALDEEASIGGVVEALRAQGVERILVVDNGSRDATSVRAQEAGAQVVHEPRLGYGRACLRGIEALAGSDAPPAMVLFLDGDQSDDPGAIHRLLNPLKAGEAELVIGVRMGSDGGALHARGGTAVVLALARWIFGLKARDLGPFRAITWAALRALELDDRTWGWTLQMQLRAHLARMRVQEVEVPRRARAGGRSKVSGSLQISLRAGARMFWTLGRERFRAAPVWDPAVAGPGDASQTS